MMQIDVENVFNNVFQAVIFKELLDVRGLLSNIIFFTMLFYGVHSFLYYQPGQHEEGVTIIDSSSSTRQGDLLRGILFALAHYRTFLETIAWAPNYVFPSLVNDIHIVGPTLL